MKKITCYISHKTYNEDHAVKGGDMRDTIFA